MDTVAADRVFDTRLAEGTSMATQRTATILTGLMLTALAWAAGCTQDKPPAGSPIEQAWETPPPGPVAEVQPTPQPAPDDAASTRPAAGNAPATRPTPAAPGAGPAVALVNGEPVTHERLVEMLVESHGISVLEQLILLTAARQRAADLGVTVTPEDVTAAQDEALRRIAAPVGSPEGAPLDRAVAERLLEDFLRLKGLSRTEWDCRMEQKAYLSKIARAEIAKLEITEPMLRDEYGLAYGERVQIRHIQAATSQAIDRAAELLATKPFEEVARQMSENPITREQGGLMPPFTRHDGAVPPLIREKAFAMEAGSTSPPLRDGTWYHIIRVERRFPASSVGFENVDSQTLRQRLTDRLTRQRTDELDADLFRAARIQIRDPRLERQFRERHQK